MLSIKKPRISAAFSIICYFISKIRAALPPALRHHLCLNLIHRVFFELANSLGGHAVFVG